MLNKEVCLNCILKSGKWMDLKKPLYWKLNERIHCQGTGRVVELDINNDEPPKDCPYKLEHIVME